MALAGIWLLTLTIVPPRGDFPLNDDFMYAKVVKHLMETGEYQPTPYADPTFILQAYWGAAFVKLLGFSFETLRISTLVLALVAVWAAHWAAREAGLTTRWAFLVALTLLVNPLFLNLSYTFMTDVPFLALCILSGAAYLRHIRLKSFKWLIIGCSIMLAAFLIRQFSLVIHLAFFSTLLMYPYASFRKTWKYLVCQLAPMLIVMLFYEMFPLVGLSPTENLDWNVLGTTWTARAAMVVQHLSVSFVYVALFTLPVGCAWFSVLLQRRMTDRWDASVRWPFLFRDSTVHSIPVIALCVIISLFLNSEWPYRLPNFGNMLYDLGTGPLLLPGIVNGTNLAAPVQIGAGAWWVITAAAILWAGGMAAIHARDAAGIFIYSRFHDPNRRRELFLSLWSLGMLLILITPPVLARFDRYFVAALVPASILAACWFAVRLPRPAHMTFIVAGLCWIFSVVCLQDYFAWNAARWKGLTALQRDHAAPIEQINGGYEFNGWFHSDFYAEESRKTGKKIFGPQGWWIRGDEYRVSLRPNKRFEVIGTEPYFSWLGWKQREILLLKRTEPDANSDLFH